MENEIEVMQEVDDEVPSTSRNNDISTLSVSVMERKCVEPVVTTPIKNMKRKRSRESAIFTEDVCSPIDGYKIIDSPVLIKMANCAAKCSYCGAEKSISLKQDNKLRKGLCETLILCCNVCGVKLSRFSQPARASQKVCQRFEC